jgi:hypothetical protein
VSSERADDFFFHCLFSEGQNMNVKDSIEQRPPDEPGDVPRNAGNGSGNDPGAPVARKGVGKPQRVLAALGRGRSVVVIGHRLDFEGWLETLQEAITKGRRARSYGLSLEAFLRMLRDVAK